MTLFDQLEQLTTEAKTRLANEDRELLRTEFLGRKGKLQALFSQLSTLSPEERKGFGQKANEAKRVLEELLLVATPAPPQTVDLTLPIQLKPHGHTHPIQEVITQLYHVFGQFGYEPFLTPQIEFEEDNFDFLRVAKDHPARDMQDTFWTKDNMVLRTHTTAFQKRAIKELKTPFAVMQGGRIYRAEAEDATHLSEFHQFDCFAIARGLSFANLKGILFKAMQDLFGPDTKIRFRPSFFPFVEPGAELDIQCFHCKGAGCKSCGGSGWLELLGCGMTHSDIIEAAGLDPKEYQGMAWGIGVERIAMLKYGVRDIREFVKNDPRFLEQL